MAEFLLPIKLTDEEKKLSGIDKLYPIIEQSFKLKDILTSIDISTEDDLAVANNKAVDAKKLVKELEAARKGMTAPLDKQKKVIMDLEKRILRPLIDGIEDITNRIIKYQDILEQNRKNELKALEQEQNKLNEFKEELKELELKIYRSIDSKKTIAELQTVAVKAIFAKDGSSALQQLVLKADSKDITELAALTKARCMQYGKAKKQELEGGENETSMLKTVLEQQMEDTGLMATNAESVTITSSIESTSNKKSIATVRKAVKFEVVDITLVPKQYTKVVVDEDAVKSFIAERKDKDAFNDLIEGNPLKIITGLEFRVEKSHVGR